MSRKAWGPLLVGSTLALAAWGWAQQGGPGEWPMGPMGQAGKGPGGMMGAARGAGAQARPSS